MKNSRANSTLIPIPVEGKYDENGLPIGKVVLGKKPERLIEYTEQVTLPAFSSKGELLVGPDDYVHCGIPVKCRLVTQPVVKFKLNPIYEEQLTDGDGKYLSSKYFDFTNDGRRIELPPAKFDNSVEHPTNMQDARTISIMNQNKALLETNQESNKQVQQLTELVKELLAQGKDKSFLDKAKDLLK